MNSFLQIAIADAGTHMGRVIRMMVDGVAFRENGVKYNVFSHAGDELGSISTADVSYAINYMKRKGRQVGTCLHPTWVNPPGHVEPAFSFHWEGPMMYNGQRM